MSLLLWRGVVSGHVVDILEYQVATTADRETFPVWQPGGLKYIQIDGRTVPTGEVQAFLLQHGHSDVVLDFSIPGSP